MFPLLRRIVSTGIRQSTEVWKYGSLNLAGQSNGSRSYSKLFYEKCLPMTKIHRTLVQQRKMMEIRRKRRKPAAYIIRKTKGMRRGIKPSSYIPSLLNQETRLDVVMPRLHFTDTVPQAKQLITHRKVCVNNAILNVKPSFQVSRADIISFSGNGRNRGVEAAGAKEVPNSENNTMM